MSARCSIRRNGTPSRPWQVYCSDCTGEAVHFVEGVGAVAVNTRGLGNRMWVLALLGALVHLRERHGR